MVGSIFIATTVEFDQVFVKTKRTLEHNSASMVASISPKTIGLFDKFFSRTSTNV